MYQIYHFTENEEKESISLFKKYQSLYFSLQTSICTVKIEDLALMWITELILTGFENHFTSVFMESTNLWHLWTAILIKDNSNVPQHFLILLQKQNLWCLPISFLLGLVWPLHNGNLVGLESRCCCLLVCLGLLSYWKPHFTSIASLA